MALTPGSRLGVYDILAAIGEGGMGQVFRARDTKLNRDVALKVLPDSFANDADRLARFTREAQTLAALNHPNIAAIYGLEESPSTSVGQAGVRALVMELVEGDDLSQRIARGALPLDEALPIARQIAEALEAAHEQGIIHRDLKPANIKVRADGTAKVLDFGLAKALDPAPASSAAAMNSPTITTPAHLRQGYGAAGTEAGMILGTAAYMSPEQAKGKPVDRRADIWAFGAVLFEMLAGKPVFRGETLTDVLAAVVQTEPDFTEVPWRTRRLLRSCLEKDPRRRLQAIGDAWLLLEDSVPDRQVSQRRPVMPWFAAAAFGLVAVAATWALWRPPVADERAVQFLLALSPEVGFQAGASGGAAISPDGRAIVFVATGGGPKLWIRRLDSLTVRELPGTNGAAYPFWSPDSRSVGFFAEGKLKRIDVSGGPPVAIATSLVARGGTWVAGEAIVFAPPAGPLQRIAASGGVPEPVTRLDPANGETAHRWPQLLPDGRHLLYFVRSTTPGRMGLYLGTLDRPDEKVFIVESATAGVYAPPHGSVPGHVLWLRGGALMAQPFDPARGQLSGEAMTIAGAEKDVGTIGALSQAAFSVSHEGTLIFGGTNDRYQLAWFSRDGKPADNVSTGRYVAVRMSPDGRHAAVSVTDQSGNRDIWTMELARGLLSRLTHETANVPIWSPDGRQIAYHTSDVTKLITVDVDGDHRQVVLESKDPVYVNDWSPDDRFVLYTTISPTTANDLWLLPTTGDRTPVPLLVTPVNESHGQFSRDGRWIAYTSDESGQQEIYVRTMTGKASTRVSTSGGNFARWRKDGRELFYRSPDGTLMAVAVDAADEHLTFGAPMALFPVVEPLGTFAYPYDISADGQRILALTPNSSERDAAPLTVIVNWEAGLRK